MKLYRAVVRPVMSFASPLQSDTFFGAFCWSFRYCYGEEKLEELLKEMESGSPSVIFSNAFPKGTLPLPLGIRDSLADFEKIENKVERRKAYQNHKKLKNARFVQREWFDKIMIGDYAGFTKGLMEEEVQEHTIIHNLVSRDAGIVKETEESGNLYEEDEFFVEDTCEYDVYILSSLDEAQLKQVIEMMLLLGIGKNKSTGKGAFELKDWQKEEGFIKKPEANAFMALSNFVPSSSDPAQGWYKTLVKYGKLDREYAASDIPFKKPILFLQSGAVFLEDAVKEFYGRCVKHVSIKDNIVVNAYTIAVPICINL